MIANLSLAGLSLANLSSVGSRVARAARLRRVAVAALFLPLLAGAGGCATYMEAQVTSFHQVSENLRLEGRRFVIEPSADQKDSLEFQAYADLVRRALVEKGLVAAGAGASSDLVVRLTYTIDGGRTMVHGYPAYGYTHYGPVWSWAPYPVPGGGVSYVWTPTYPMSYGVVGTHYAQSTLYRRELHVVIEDRKPGGDGRRLYEGTVISEGGSASLAPVMQPMVRALFSDFPGRNGVTRIVQVPFGDASNQPVQSSPAPAPESPGQPPKRVPPAAG
jgi:hypothetical protein